MDVGPREIIPNGRAQSSFGRRLLVQRDENDIQCPCDEANRPYVGTVNRNLNLSRLTWILAPAAGAVFITLWWIAEAGRLGYGLRAILLSLTPFVGFGVAIGISRKWPSAAFGLTGAVLVLQLLIEGARFGATSWPAYIPLVYVVFNASAFGSPLMRRLALPLAVAYATAVALLLTLPALGWPVFYAGGSPRRIRTPADLDIGATVPAACIIAIGLAVGAWCAGLAVRAVRKAHDARLRAQELERELTAAEAELVALTARDRLAQDVHDVMAHSLAVIAAQADGTRMADPSLPPTAYDALMTIADASRDGLKELRMLLEDASADECPDLTELPILFDRVQAAGHGCELVVHGHAKSLTSTQQLSVYRIAQEALTNALKHTGTAAHTRATLDWRGPGLALLVATTPVAAAGGPTRPGRGIRGMQERARLAGGWLTAGADESETFIVNAFVPTGELVPTAEAGTDEVQS